MSSYSNVVETCYGKVRGLSEKHVDSFLGIPFAAPPEGKLRFRSPIAPGSWSGIKDVTEFGDRSVQSSALMDKMVGPDIVSTSEDCLTLNLWRPRTSVSNGESKIKLPVMVFIHGGGFFCGSGSHPSINGTKLAHGGQLIVITLQYRLGVLGLLCHPDLEDPDTGHYGNWAFQDQIAALTWVQDNVASFGGDKDKVTIFGESAGGASVSLHCISPVSRPLFRRAIVESSSPLPATQDMAGKGAAALFDKLQINSDITTLQNLSIERILASQGRWIAAVTGGRLAPRPMIDGTLLLDWPKSMMDAGLTKDLDIMTSYNRDELSYLTLYMEADAIPNSSDRVIKSLLNLQSEARDLYGIYAEARKKRGESTAPYDIWIAIRTDQMIRVPAMEFLAQHGDLGNRAWATCINWRSNWRLPQIENRTLGACHMIDLPLVFGTYDDTEALRNLAHGDGVEMASTAIQSGWVAFAKTGDPNCEALPNWSRYTSSQRSTMILGAECKLEVDPSGTERMAMEEALK